MGLVAYTPIEQLLTVAQQNRVNRALDNKLRQLIDIIIFRVQHKSLEQVSSNLLDDLLEVRIKSLDWFSKENKDLHSLSTTINTPYPVLNRAFKKTITTYFKIISTATTIRINGFDDGDIISYSGLKKLVQSYPIPTLEIFVKWLESSLKLEFGIIVTALIEHNIIEQPTYQLIEELSLFLRYKIEQFGAYAILLNVWQPKENEHGQWIENIRFVASVYQMDMDRGEPITKATLKELLLS